MKKSQLVDTVVGTTGLAKRDVEATLEATLDAITDAVKSGDKVTLTGFGNFERRERAARTGRNPQTGAEMQVAASKTPAFRPGKAFKDAVNG